MRIAIFGNTYNSLISTYLRVLFEFLADKNIKILIDKDLYESAVSSCDSCSDNIELIDGTGFVADFAISIGGDGTFLKTASMIGNKPIAVLGVNIGRLGFLADVPGENMIQAVSAMIENKLITEERTLLKVERKDGVKIKFPYALNEVSVLKQDSSSMISIHTTLNGEPVHTYQADGLLISTPTGSTAYSMSVGGPIVVPQASNFILSPVASHSLNVRPLIVPDSWTIDLEVKSRSGSFQLALDGNNIVLDDKTTLRIKKADFTIRILKQPRHTFFDNLKNKLMWGVDKRN